MQLGMIGLGRMGANMVRRLMQRRAISAWCTTCRRRRCRDWSKEGAVGATSLDDFVAKLDARRAPPGSWCRRRWSTRRSPISAARLQRGDIIIDGGNSYYIDDIRRAERAAGEGHPLRRLRHQRRRLGPRARLLPDDRRRERHRAAPRSDLRRAGAVDGLGAAHAGAREDHRQHRRARLSALRPERRRPLRQDGAQRHRVRHHGGLRRGAQHPAQGQRRQSQRRRSTPRRRRCAIPSTTSTTSTSPTSPRCGGAAASSRRGCSTSPPQAFAGDPKLEQVRRPRLRLRRGALDASRPPSTKASRRTSSAPRCSSASSSRGEADFADKLLSAMRFEFGGHLEKGK